MTDTRCVKRCIIIITVTYWRRLDQLQSMWDRHLQPATLQHTATLIDRANVNLSYIKKVTSRTLYKASLTYRVTENVFNPTQSAGVERYTQSCSLWDSGDATTGYHYCVCVVLGLLRMWNYWRRKWLQSNTVSWSWETNSTLFIRGQRRCDRWLPHTHTRLTALCPGLPGASSVRDKLPLEICNGSLFASFRRNLKTRMKKCSATLR